MNNPVNSFSYFIHHNGNNINRIPTGKIDFYHLTFVMDGSFTYIVDGKKIVLEKNDALLLVPGTERERIFTPDNVHFVLFNYLPTKGNEVQSNILFKNAVNKTIKRLLNAYPYNNHLDTTRINVTSKENEKTKIVLQNIFNCILIELFDTLKYNTENAHVLKILNHINDNIAEPLTLKSISDSIHLSKEYTARIFKKEMGMTVSNFVNQQKLNLAKNMLSNDALSLQDISNKLGYENYCYFSKIFKSQFGITPHKLKKELSLK